MIITFSAPALVHGARISGLEARMDQVEDRICDLDARGSEEADNLANDRDLDRFILTGESGLLIWVFKLWVISLVMVLILV